MPPRAEILAVGALGRDLRPAFDHYARLIRPWLALDVREVREVQLKGRSPVEVLREEGRRLSAAWPAAPGTAVALAVDGVAYDSEGLAAALERWLERGRLTFVVGGSLGLGEDVASRADERLSLSPLTLPHQLARVVLAEQLFRALSILRHHPYHH
jgi:23S rRNA (pseudouridine1915-N3)-methyltransferase